MITTDTIISTTKTEEAAEITFAPNIDKRIVTTAIITTHIIYGNENVSFSTAAAPAIEALVARIPAPRLQTS